MSYMRHGSIHQFFKSGKSSLYIYGSKDRIEDYQSVPNCDNKNLVELIGHIIYSDVFYCKDSKFVYCVVETLATRLGIQDELKPYDEVFDENNYWRDAE